MSIRYSLSILPVLLVTSTLVGHAPAVSADGPVYACASRYFGFMRLVKKPKCRRRERLVTFPAASGDGGGEGNAELQARLDDLNTKLDNLQVAHDLLAAQIGTLETENLNRIADVSRLDEADDGLATLMAESTGGVQPIAPAWMGCIDPTSSDTDVIIQGCNLHVRNAMGTTDSKDGVVGVGIGRGTGNLIIGYNEDEAGDKERTGSHNLVVGGEHTYSSFGGLVAGYRNSVTGPNSSVTGGMDNSAQGNQTSVSGGANNTAKGGQSSISGGSSNETEGTSSSISGGYDNGTLGVYSAVSGGTDNKAIGQYSSVLGGAGSMAWDNEMVPPMPAP